jgi:hypothetical protein
MTLELVMLAGAGSIDGATAALPGDDFLCTACRYLSLFANGNIV